MTYLSDMAAISAEFHPGTKTEELTMKSGTVARFVAPGSATRGQFGLFEWRMPAQTGGVDAHFHRNFSESFFVTSGAVQLFDGERWVLARSGDFLYVPEGGAHGFRNDTDEPATMLILFAPAPQREAYFRELAEIGASGRTLTDDEWVELWARHDQYPVR